IRHFPCRKNRRTNLNDECRSDDIRSRDAINFPPLQLREEAGHKHTETSAPYSRAAVSTGKCGGAGAEALFTGIRWRGSVICQAYKINLKEQAKLLPEAWRSIIVAKPGSANLRVLRMVGSVLPDETHGL